MGKGEKRILTKHKYFDLQTELHCDGLLLTYDMCIKDTHIVVCSGSCLFNVREQEVTDTHDYSPRVCLLTREAHLAIWGYVRTINTAFRNKCLRAFPNYYRVDEDADKGDGGGKRIRMN